MKTIKKYNITTARQQQLSLPIGAQILTVKDYGSKIALLAFVDTDVVDHIEHTLYIYDTDQNIVQDNVFYLGTANVTNRLLHVCIIPVE